MTEFSLQVVEEMMHKKRTFYSYALHPKNSISKHVMLHFKSDNRSSHIDESLQRATSLANAEVAFYFVNNVKVTLSSLLKYAILTNIILFISF